MPLKSEVSCSSVQGSLRLSGVDLLDSADCFGVPPAPGLSIAMASSSATGVEAAFAFFLGGMIYGVCWPFIILGSVEKERKARLRKLMGIGPVFRYRNSVRVCGYF
jgi:hypothetical protein